MARDATDRSAKQRIKAPRQEEAVELDLSSMGLAEVLSSTLSNSGSIAK